MLQVYKIACWDFKSNHQDCSFHPTAFAYFQNWFECSLLKVLEKSSKSNDQDQGCRVQDMKHSPTCSPHVTNNDTEYIFVSDTGKLMMRKIYTSVCPPNT